MPDRLDASVPRSALDRPAGPLRLRVESGPERGLLVELPSAGKFVIGRGDTADLRLFDERSSRQHCVIDTTAERIVLRDLESRNGTWMNGRRIDTRELQPGDRFSVGNTTLRFFAGTPDDHDTVAAAAADSISVKSSISPGQIAEIASRTAQSERLAELFRFQGALKVDAGLGPMLDDALDRASAPEFLAADTMAVVIFGATIAEPLRFSRRRPASRRKFDVSRRVLERVQKSGEALVLADVKSRVSAPAGAFSSAAADDLPPSAAAVPVSAGMFVPLKDRDEIFGVLYADRRAAGSRRPFGPTDLSFAVMLSDILAPAIRTAQRFDDLHVSGRFSGMAGGSDGGNGAINLAGDAAFAVVGNSDALLSCLRTVAKVAPTDVSVLITGETGTGKELFARALHHHGTNPDGPFIALNCAAIPADLLEAELFGHEAGAFTGATRARPGKLELADGGTLFLDEIGEFPPGMQPKLLRVLQEKTYFRLGGHDLRRADFRLVTATNRDLPAEVKAGKFREDLLYRIRVVTIHLPPLRERRTDIDELAEFFLRRISTRLSRRLDGFSGPAMEALHRYEWPGNVRELANVIERAVVLCDGPHITPDHLPAEMIAPPTPTTAVGADSGGAAEWPSDAFPTVLTLRDAERRAIVTALRATAGKKGEAARLLGTSWPTLNKKIRDYDIDTDAI